MRELFERASRGLTVIYGIEQTGAQKVSELARIDAIGFIAAIEMIG